MTDPVSPAADQPSDEHATTNPFTYDELYQRRTSKPLRELPGLIRGALVLVLKASRRDTLIILGVTILQAILTIAQLLLIRRLLADLGHVSDGTRSVESMVPTLIAFVTVFTVQGMSALVDSQVRQILAEEVTRHAQSLVARAAVSADLLEFERPSFHDRLQRSLANATTRPLQTAFAVMNIISATLTAAAIAVALATIQPLFLLLVFVAFGPLWLVIRRMTRMGFAFSVAESEADRRRSYFLYLLSSKDSAKELRAYQLADEIDSRHSALWTGRLQRLRVLTGRRLKVGLIGRAVNGLMLGSILAVLAWSVSSGRADVAQAGVAAGAVVLLGQRLGVLLGAVGMLYECSLFLEDVATFLEERRVVESNRSTGELPGPLEELRAQGIHFSYPAGRGEALAGIDVNVRPGEMIALVGLNGSGKTTLAKVLAGLFQPDAGTITWNGVNAASIDRAEWTSNVAMVFQDFARYMLTLAENVGFGRVEQFGDESRLAIASSAGGIDDLVASLPKGYHTLLGPEFYGGSDLSGGQWQRVALARAFFRDAPVVILDEPSSALDPQAEAELFERMKELGTGRAVVIISHRFGTVKAADRIYLLETGRVVECGSHAHLMSIGEKYATLFQTQAARYTSSGADDSVG